MTLAFLVLRVALEATPDPPEIVEVREVCQRASGLIDARKTDVVVVASGEKTWSRIESLEQLPHGDGFIPDAARVHLAGGRVLMVEYWVQTPSGDWQNRSEHFFREDGTLAFVLEQHLTYNVGSEEAPRPLTIESRRYFDRAGKKVRSMQKTVAPGGKVFPTGSANPDRNAPVFMRVRDLPFAKLLRG